MFQSGVDLDLSKLYPRIEYPVSRGTPMISPLIKWDHSEDHFVTDYENNAAKASLNFIVNIKDPEFEYLQGHTIDGKAE